jgi:hypothetical protein
MEKMFFKKLVTFWFALLLIIASCSPKNSLSIFEKPLPPFLSAQLTEDLKDAKITKEAMEVTWLAKKSDTSFVRYKYIEGRLSASISPHMRMHPRYVVVTEALERIFSAHSFANLDFIVCLGDALHENTSPAPLFTFAKKQGAERLILIPDCEALNPVDRQYLTNLMAEGKREHPWSEKIASVFWRGAPTGPIPTANDIESNHWANSPRFQLVKLSEKLPRLIDAAFICWNGVNENKEILAKTFRLTSSVNPKNHLPYKYLIDVDGNSCCYSRTFWILLSNSVMLKQKTDDVQWFYKGLVPFVHFIPLNYNLSDLEEKIEYCQKHEEIVQKVTLQANDFAQNHLQYENNLDYLAHLLQEYGSHMQYKPVLEQSDLKASIPAYQKFYFDAKAFLRKRLRSKPIASLHS